MTFPQLWPFLPYRALMLYPRNLLQIPLFVLQPILSNGIYIAVFDIFQFTLDSSADAK